MTKQGVRLVHFSHHMVPQALPSAVLEPPPPMQSWVLPEFPRALPHPLTIALDTDHLSITRNGPLLPKFCLRDHQKGTPKLNFLGLCDEDSFLHPQSCHLRISYFFHLPSRMISLKIRWSTNQGVLRASKIIQKSHGGPGKWLKL